VSFDLSDQALWIFAAAIFVLLNGARWAGYRVGSSVHARSPGDEAASTAVGFVTGGLLMLFAFILGIALSMASTRLEARRDSVLNEANAIGTAWLRASLVEGPEAAHIQHLLREYTEVRITAVRGVASPEQESQSNARTNQLQNAIWNDVQAIARKAPNPITVSLVASVNDTFDLALTNRRNFASHVPPVIVRLLLIVSVLAVGAMGYHFGLSGSGQLVISTLLLVMWTASIVLVADIDNPRAGQVRIDPAPLVWTLQGFGPPP
jgi:hypothetical protein